MFLKRIEMQGFKSFADKVVINFEHNITGVVGPNGCGKSNITDAIRWVLGEQSAKSLRGTSMTDVIFAGSQDRRMVNMAEVTLVFDNDNHALNSDLKEIEVTRRIYRNQEAQYLINRNPVRLKDIIDLILDSGLGKDSLSMISQGNITSFAEAKPIDRRAIFEEAAGVAKYKKRKLESLAKLQRTKDNIDRCNDIIIELEKQVSPLKRQAKKAKIYREKKERLQQIEIAVLVDDIKTINEHIENAKKDLFDIETKITMYQTSIQIQENEILDQKQLINSLERDINNLQESLMHVVNEIQILEKRKTELDEKRKYAIETGSKQQKSIEIKQLLSEAKIEYDDRLNRLNLLKKDIELLSTQLSNTAFDISEYYQKNEECLNYLHRLANRKEVLENMSRSPFNNQQGVKNIMENKNSLNGVLEVIAKCFKAKDGYEEAISIALGQAMYNIVTKDEKSARNAIDFLKKNQCGRATFLPLNVCKKKWISKEHLIICQNSKGYLGIASDFVENESIYDAVKDLLLNNIIVVDKLENGNELNKLLNYNYKIVTLDGDVIYKGGSMSGGKIKNSTSLITLNKEINDINTKLVSAKATSDLAFKTLNDAKNKKADIESLLMEKRIQLAQLEPIVDVKRSKYEKLKSDLELLDPNNNEDVSFSDDIITNLNSAYSQRDDITTSIKLKRENRMKLYNDNDRKEQQLKQIRKDLQAALNLNNDIKISMAKSETKLENSLNRLSSEYKMTYEYALNLNIEHIENAREEVMILRQEIEALGNVNMNAPEEYEEVNSRYEFLNKQIEDLNNSKDKLLKAIDEMDMVMTKQFKQMFNAINNEFNDTFRQLFGGGKAKLILEDSSDILNTGIDIDVQPPGKAVQNIRLFSGGEKALIAICVIFSILKVKPVPLIIFDEVEAALDQANVERFAKYLKTFADHTQFIVVTHRPGTMEQCDVLYGVTMQKQGVSQMLKVELYDAIKMADKQDKEN
ncbi:MAG: AAA family ATPase [Erysipelotrichaceae bacterium]|nr:AAA family ATPase [Erysipelotrichaceae bacterium]